MIDQTVQFNAKLTKLCIDRLVYDMHRSFSNRLVNMFAARVGTSMDWALVWRKLPHLRPPAGPDTAVSNLGRLNEMQSKETG